MRIAFYLIPIGSKFRFVNNPLSWTKLSDFECGLEDGFKCSAIDKKFTTDSLVDLQNANFNEVKEFLEGNK